MLHHEIMIKPLVNLIIHIRT